MLTNRNLKNLSTELNISVIEISSSKYVIIIKTKVLPSPLIYM